MPQNKEVSLGQRSRFLLVIGVFLGLGCSSQKVPFSELDKSEATKIYTAVGNLDWDRVLRLSENAHDSLLQILHLRALYELKRYSDVLQFPPNKDLRFAPYDRFLRLLSAYESKNWDLVLTLEVPNDLPIPLRERISILQGEAHAEKQEWEAAKDIFSRFLRKYKDSPFETDVLFRLADVYFSLNNKDKALILYEQIYRQHPIDDLDDIARQKLQDAGRFALIDTDIHLARIERLRKAARFSRAQKELEALQVNAPLEKQNRVALAVGQLHFAAREYEKSLELARAALKSRHLSLEIQLEWRLILAQALIRTRDEEEGHVEYEKLLKFKLPPAMRELVLYKIAMLSIDQGLYAEAARFLESLRREFPHGSHLESAYWFGAWALYENEAKRAGGASLEELKKAVQLLNQLPRLPESKVLIPQGLYWKASIAKLSLNTEEEEKNLTDLEKNWSLSFHSLLLKPKPFQFLNEMKLSSTDQVWHDFVTPDLSIKAGIEKSFYRDISWQRLESFRSVNLKTWAKMELERFVEKDHDRNLAILMAIAKRFQSVEDWSDLVRWSEHHFDLSLKDLDVHNPLLKFHYPRAYPKAVLKSAKEFGVSPFLVWGLMREESRYEADSISHAGAIGLMQLMPWQANKIGERLGEPTSKRILLTDSERNIRYGVYHLKELRTRVAKLDVPENLKPVLVVAAYNAGLEAVERWLKEKDTSRVDIFVESIPFSETRFYVKRVLQSAYIYFRLYGEVAKEVVVQPTEKPL